MNDRGSRYMFEWISKLYSMSDIHHMLGNDIHGLMWLIVWVTVWIHLFIFSIHLSNHLAVTELALEYWHEIDMFPVFKEFPILGAVFLSTGTVDILDWLILCCADCPMHCRVFSSIPGLCLLAASSPLSVPHSWWPKIYPDCQNAPDLGRHKITPDQESLL